MDHIALHSLPFCAQEDGPRKDGEALGISRGALARQLRGAIFEKGSFRNPKKLRKFYYRGDIMVLSSYTNIE